MRRKILAALLAVLTVLLLTAASSGGRNFKADLSGANEVPAVESDTTGRATFHADREETEIRFTLRVRNADGILGAAGAHIHCGPEAENGPIVAFLAGPVVGGLDGSVVIRATLSGENIDDGAGCGSTIAELLDSMRDGDTYVNVHSIANPGGEVRGQIG
jgi:hypothetical protein